MTPFELVVVFLPILFYTQYHNLSLASWLLPFANPLLILVQRPVRRDSAIMLLVTTTFFSVVMVMFRCHVGIDAKVMEKYPFVKAECTNSIMGFAVSCGIAVLFILQREWE